MRMLEVFRVELSRARLALLYESKQLSQGGGTRAIIIARIFAIIFTTAFLRVICTDSPLQHADLLVDILCCLELVQKGMFN